MDYTRFDSAKIKLCLNCKYPIYCDLNKEFFVTKCKLCDTIIQNLEPNFKFKGKLTTKYQLLKDSIKFTIDKYKIDLVYDHSQCQSNDLMGQFNQSKKPNVDWEHLPINYIFYKISEFDLLSYFGINRVYTNHNLYEFLILSELLSSNRSFEELTTCVSKYYYSIFRYSSLNPPNYIQLETKLDFYNSLKCKPNRYSENRKEHIQKHLHTNENQFLNSKSSCRPWIRSTNFSRAIHEINRFIANNLSPSKCLCLRFGNSLLQLRVYYANKPALIMIINDFPKKICNSVNIKNSYLITCYTSNDIVSTLKELGFTNKLNINLLPDFLHDS